MASFVSPETRVKSGALQRGAGGLLGVLEEPLGWCSGHKWRWREKVLGTGSHGTATGREDVLARRCIY